MQTIKRSQILSAVLAAALVSTVVWAGTSLKPASGSGGGSGLTPVSNNTILGNNSGSTAIPTALTATQTLGVLGYGTPGQADAIWRFVQSAYPTITGFRCETLYSEIPGGTANGAPVNPFASPQSLLEGGGLRPNNGSFLTYVGGATWQTPKTGPWVIAYRGRHAGASSGHDGTAGMANAAGSHLWAIGRMFGASSTHFVIRSLGTSDTLTAGTASSDGNVHTFVLGWDGTTLKGWVDPTVGASPDAATSTAPGMSDEVMAPFVYSGVAGESDFQFFCKGFVAP